MSSNTLQVTTTAGPVLGFADTFPLRDSSAAPQIEAGEEGGLKPVYKWLGVPYAHAGRWERPSPPQPWTTPLKAWEFASMFPQPPSGTEKIFGHQPGVLHRDWVTVSEDSHTVNIFAPEGTKPSDSLPVLVWIYGGSLNNGSAHKFFYDPTEWIRASPDQPFIMVTGNYRTNIFGFFSGPDVLATDDAGLCGNYGLYDCVAMLEWVQSNISAFGGNPQNVTCFGQSAGAFLVSNLLVSGKKLFQRAIMQSGACETMSIRPSDVSYPSYSTILNFHGPGGATPLARMNALRSVPYEDLLKAHNETYRFGGVSLTLEEGPNAVWDRATIEKLREGRWDPWIERVIIGTTEDEGTIFAFGMQLNTSAAWSSYLSTFPASLQPLITAKYLANEPHPATTSLIDAPAAKVLADRLFVDPAWEQAVAMSGTKNVSSGNKCRVYVYRVRAEVDRVSRGEIKCGAMHVIEIPLIFNANCMWEPDSHEAASAKVIGSCWSSFATSGNPDPNWKPFTPDSPSWFVFEDGGKTENESLEGFAEKRIDWTGKNFGVPLEVTNE